MASGAEGLASGDEEIVPGREILESAEVERDDDVQPKLPVPSPTAPAASQLAEHRDGGHMPYRTWCGECAETFGREEAHSTHDRVHGRKVAVVSLDYFFITPKGLFTQKEIDNLQDDDLSKSFESSPDVVEVLIIYCSLTRSVFAHAVRRKRGR